MNINKESLGLTLKNNGPNLSGYYEDLASQNLYLETDNPIKHQTNWDAGLTSLQNTTRESFQNFGATNYLGFNNQVSDIQIVDDLAFISYGNYTDINKTVATYKNAALTLPYELRTRTNYDAISNKYRMINGLFYLNFLDTSHVRNVNELYYNRLAYGWDTSRIQNDLDNPKVPVDLSNLFIYIKYKGTYSPDNIGYLSTTLNLPDISHLGNRGQLFSYEYFTSSSNFLSLGAGKFNDASENDIGIISYNDSLIPAPRKYKNNLCLNTGIQSLFDESWTDARSNFVIRQYDREGLYAFSFINIVDINLICDVYLIKYTPVSNCGKVDVLQRKTGTISGFTPEGYMVSPSHSLENGDIIRISSVLKEDLNGIKFVQVLDSNTCILYNDSNFTERLYREEYKATGATWTCISNVYSMENNQWKYKKTITSPEGRNRYGNLNNVGTAAIPVITSYTTENLLPPEINGCETYRSLIEVDYNIDIDDASLPILDTANRINENDTNSIHLYNTGIIKERDLNKQSVLDNWRLGLQSYVNNFRFGCSIDVKKNDNKYYLLVGERGPQTGLHLDHLNLPIRPLCGQSYLFQVDEDLNCSLIRIHKASLASDIEEAPNSCSYIKNTVNTAGGPLLDGTGIYDLGVYNQLYNYSLINYSSSDKDNANIPRLIEFQHGYQYWYGAMVMHLRDTVSDTSMVIPGYLNDYQNFDSGSYVSPYNNINTYGQAAYVYNNSCRSSYFTDPNYLIYVPRFVRFYYSDEDSVLLTGEISNKFPRHGTGQGFWQFNEGVPISYYPYTDSFGKSVALDIIDGDFHVFCSSKSKPYINRPEEGLRFSELDDSSLSCQDTTGLLSSTSCGYIHCFINGVHIQKIHEDGITTPSRSFRPQYHRAEQFAQKMIARDGQLIFGMPKPIELASSSLVADFTLLENDKSKINFYNYNGSIYTKSKVLENRNHRKFYISNSKNVSSPDHKETAIKNKSLINGIRISKYYPSDNFGAEFKYRNGILLTNAYDHYNEFNVDNGYQTDPGLTTQSYLDSLTYVDYIQIYEEMDDALVYRGKISACFSSDDTQYSYADVLEPALYKSLKSLGNYNYSNTTTNSKTWDILLNGRYDIIDDRIILKDPLGYAIFQKTTSEKLNRRFQCIFNKSAIIEDFPDLITKGAARTGRLIHTNPVISFGKTGSSSVNYQRSGDSYGSYSAAYDILSIDNYSTSNFYFANTLSTLDAHPYEYLGLNMVGSIDGYSTGPTTELFLEVIDFSVDKTDLFIKVADAKNNNLNLLMPTIDINSSSCDLFLSQENFGLIPLFLQMPDYQSSGAITIVTSGKDWEPKNNNINLITGGFTNNSNLDDNTTLYLESKKTDGNLNLYFNSLEFNNSMPISMNPVKGYPTGSVELRTINGPNDTTLSPLNIFLKTFESILDSQQDQFEEFGGSAPLLMIGPDYITYKGDSAPLFLSKNVYSVSTNELGYKNGRPLDLQMYGSTQDVLFGGEYGNYSDLFLMNLFDLNNGMDLRLLNKGLLSDQDLLMYNTQSIVPYVDSADLFISTENTLFNAPLFIQVNDLTENSSDLDLFMYGALTSVGIDRADLELIINGTEYGNNENYMPLFMYGPLSLDNGASAPLLISNYQTNEENSKDLIIYGSIAETEFGDTDSGVLNLYIRSANIVSGDPNNELTLDDEALTLGGGVLTLGENTNITSLPLFLNRNGLGGGEELENGANLYMKNEFGQSELDLSINSTYVDEDGVDLYMADGVGISPEIINLFIRGFKE